MRLLHDRRESVDDAVGELHEKLKTGALALESVASRTRRCKASAITAWPSPHKRD